MNYIYDIVLNFNKEVYSFYDWNKEDNIEFYIKIPIFRIENELIKTLLLSDFTVDKRFLSLIYNKTTKYSNKKTKTVKYSVLFSSDDICFGVQFDDSGKSIKKSLLGIDEETEVIDYSKSIKYNLIDFKIDEEKKQKNKYLTRKEINDKSFIINELKEIYKNKEESKLNYIFFEVYNERITNLQKEYSKLINLVENDSNKLDNLSKIIKNIKKTKTC